jgi:regulator of cell morphogenesis and NO signaling
MLVLEEVKVGDVVSSNINAAHIFKKYGIDFCCGGGISIHKACEKGNVDMKSLLQDLNNLDGKVMPSQNFKNWELDFLIDYIINTHHIYVKESIEMLDAYASKVAKVHGEGHPPVLEIYQLFLAVAAELTAHMHKEEVILFPFIKNLVATIKTHASLAHPPFGTVQNPIRMMEEEHEKAGDLLKEIARLSNNYTPPDWACNTFKALYAKLDEFEQDLHLHVHLENNILFPKALALEAKLVNS